MADYIARLGDVWTRANVLISTGKAEGFAANFPEQLVAILNGALPTTPDEVAISAMCSSMMTGRCRVSVKIYKNIEVLRRNGKSDYHVLGNITRHADKVAYGTDYLLLFASQFYIDKYFSIPFTISYSKTTYYVTPRPSKNKSADCATGNNTDRRKGNDDKADKVVKDADAVNNASANASTPVDDTTAASPVKTFASVAASAMINWADDDDDFMPSNTIEEMKQYSIPESPTQQVDRPQTSHSDRSRGRSTHNRGHGHNNTGHGGHGGNNRRGEYYPRSPVNNRDHSYPYDHSSYDGQTNEDMPATASRGGYRSRGNRSRGHATRTSYD